MKSIHFSSVAKQKSKDYTIWGIPDLKQFPLDSPEQIKTAEAHFHFCPPEYKIQLAHNIVARAQKMYVNINNPEILQWASYW